MAVDFVRSSGSKITCATSPVGIAPMILECWFICDGWTDAGQTYGNLAGIYSTTYLPTYELRAALRISRNALAVPPYSLEFVVTTFSGTYISYVTLPSLPTTWTHALGWWQSTGSKHLRLLKGGVGANTVPVTGLFLGSKTFDIGWDPTVSGNHFDGRIAEVAVWYQNVTSEVFTSTAYIGLPPIHRDPFYYTAPQRLRAWLPLRNTGASHDIMRPGITYTETNVTSHEDHPPIIQPLMTIQRGGPAVEAEEVQRMGVVMTPTLII